MEDALRRVEGDRELLEDLWKDFIRHVVKSMEAMDRALIAGDLDTLLRQAHSLRSASGSVGALLLMEEALKLEKASAQRDLQSARAVYGNLSVESDKVVRALKKLLKGN